MNNLFLHPDDTSFVPHKFSHRAMATLYEIFIVHERREYAAQAAQEAFFELDRLEEDLSRFIANSDISRINKSGFFQPVRVGIHAFTCLKDCSEFYKTTGGAFDVSVGPLLRLWINEDKSPRVPDGDEIKSALSLVGMENVRLNDADFTVSLLKNGVSIDLGGYGKGYAVDCLCGLLEEWDIRDVLIHGGMSSVLAGSHPDEPGWHVTISNPAKPDRTISHFYLKNRAMSGSGIRKGQHIIDPRTGQPLSGRLAAWVFSEKAAEADALSTAFMILPKEAIREYCSTRGNIGAVILDGTGGEEGTINLFGNVALLAT